MRNKDKATVRRLLGNARYEVLPTASIEAKVVESVPTDVTVTITSSPSMGLDRGPRPGREPRSAGV